MSTNTPHGAHGCPCEDCLGDRISRRPRWRRPRRDASRPSGRASVGSASARRARRDAPQRPQLTA